MTTTEGTSRMTVETAGNAPAEPPRTLAEALSALQGRLPHVAKTETAEVIHKDGTGKHEYTYAGLAAVTYAIMPLLSELGLSFTSKPTLQFTDGHPEAPPKFVLQYTLRHVSGEEDGGLYPLPAGLSPQLTGSAITYARRYCLCAVTGLAPENDDDAAAAEAGLRQQARETQAPRQGAGGKLRSVPKQDQEQKPEPEADRQAAQAQALADLAVKLTETDGKTVDDLRTQVYKPAESKRMLRAPVIDPVTGERSQLTAVISAAKARMESAAETAQS